MCNTLIHGTCVRLSLPHVYVYYRPNYSTWFRVNQQLHGYLQDYSCLLPFIARCQQRLLPRCSGSHRGQNRGSLVRQSKGAVTFFTVPSHAETTRRADDVCPSPSCLVASVRRSDWGSLASTLSQGCKLIAWSSLSRQREVSDKNKR